MVLMFTLEVFILKKPGTMMNSFKISFNMVPFILSLLVTWVIIRDNLDFMIIEEIASQL